MTLKDLLVKLRTLWCAVVSDQRSYGCLPDSSRDAQPVEKVGTADPSLPKSANSVEKDASLR
jgi:ribosomal protein S16